MYVCIKIRKYRTICFYGKNPLMPQYLHQCSYLLQRVLVKVCCLLQLHNFRVMSIFLCVCKVDLF